jgi:hypothetical protein
VKPDWIIIDDPLTRMTDAKWAELRELLKNSPEPIAAQTPWREGDLLDILKVTKPCRP